MRDTPWRRVVVMREASIVPIVGSSVPDNDSRARFPTFPAYCNNILFIAEHNKV